MTDQHRHLSDEEILLASDGELTNRRTAQVRAHLSSCWTCRTRMGEIESTIADFVRTYQRSLDPQVPPAVGPRVKLRARLAAMAAESKPRLWQVFPRLAMSLSAFGYLSAILSIMAVGAWMYNHYVLGPALLVDRVTAAAIPKRNLTPGAARPISLTDVCKVRSDEETSVIPVPIEKKVFEEYGIPNARPSDYEVDYLITPELGGATDIRNLWPEPHSSTVWNSYAKDDLENRLHQLVCDGKVALPDAQHDIAANWISAYKKYFHTDRPILNHTASPPDTPHNKT